MIILKKKQSYIKNINQKDQSLFFKSKIDLIYK